MDATLGNRSFTIDFAGCPASPRPLVLLFSDIICFTHFPFLGQALPLRKLGLRDPNFLTIGILMLGHGCTQDTILIGSNLYCMYMCFLMIFRCPEKCRNRMFSVFGVCFRVSPVPATLPGLESHKHGVGNAIRDNSRARLRNQARKVVNPDPCRVDLV